MGVSNSGGAIVSCNIAPSLPTGLALSSGCVLSGTPSIVASNTTYTITANNTGGSDTATFALLVRASGGSLALSSAHREGVNSSLQNITMSYTHSISNYGWTSGVTNTSSIPESSTNPIAGTSLVMWDNGDRAIAWTRQVSGSPVLALSVQSGGTWSTQNLDTASSTGYRPSMAIDGNGALHIAYLDRDNTRLRYATNASGSWAFSTLDESSVNPANDVMRTDLAIDASGHIHIIHPVQGSGVWVLNHTTNRSGSWVSTTITDTTADDGKYASMAIAGDGSLHISVYRDSGGSDLRYYTDETGVWTNETVHTGKQLWEILGDRAQFR